MTDVFRTTNVCVRVRASADASRWVVTFDNFGLGPGFDRLGFGERFLIKYGVSAIHVMGAGDDWYQYPEMIEAMAAVRGVTDGADVVMTYGSSMGGYAAIRFAEAARATATLALSPQHNIDPSRPPFDSRWRESANRIRWLPQFSGPLQPSGRPPVIAYDSRSPDAAQIAAISAEIAITPIPLPYGGHPISTRLEETGLLKPLFFAVLEDRLDVRAICAEARRRRNAPVYLTEISQALAARRPHVALALAERGVGTFPANTRVVSNLGALQIRSGLREDGLAALERAVAIWRNDTTLIPYVDALVEAGRREEVKPLVEEVVALRPDMGNVRLWQAMVAWRLEDYASARTACIETLRLDPTNAHAPAILAACDAALAAGDPPSSGAPRKRRARRLAALLRRAYRGPMRRAE